MKQKMTLARAKILADYFVKTLSSYCQRIEIAGSIRRQKAEIGDIELVAIPVFETDLFGNVIEQHALDGVDWDHYGGKIVKGGHKYKQIEFSEINLDLFIITPPAQWGIQFMIRTGPAEFSHRLVTPRKFGGMMPSNYRVQDGAIWSNNHIIETPEEADVFNLIGAEYIPPNLRK